MRSLVLALLLSSGAAPAAQPSQPQDLLYRVKRGDTLIDLAQRGLRRQADYAVVQRYNRIGNDRRLQPGSTLRIPYRLLRTQPVGAKVIAFRGGAQVDGGPARTGTPVAEGAMLRTGADAFLTIELSDGSLLTLPSRSAIKVTGLHRVVLTGTTIKQFDLIEGRTETEVQKAVRPDDRYEIRTPVSVAAVRGTKFRATFGEGASASGTSVLEGTVGVAAGQKTVAVPQGQGVVASADGPGELLPLLPKPALQNPDKVQDEDLVAFAVAPQPGAASYRLQLARDAGFIETFAEAEDKAPALTFAGVPNGSFFVRATAISPEGIEGFPSTYSFERRLNSIKAEVGEPEECPARRCLRFRWRAAGEGERRYRFQLTAKPGGTPIIDAPEMTANEITLTDLPGGTYYWRVESALIDGRRRQSKWMDYQELRVAPAARR